MTAPARVAIVADVHLHDLHAGYGAFPSADGIALRSLADSFASTRVFNESEAAFLAILGDIARRGIRDVVLPGDLTDDGQPGAFRAFQRIARAHADQFGMRFYATLGNHDGFGPERLPRPKYLTDAEGFPLAAPPIEGLSSAEAMAEMAGFGLQPPAHGMHWETPFGTSPAFAARIAPGSAGAQIDSSYLVEPQPGLWLLLLDANVFARRGEAWHLLADAAWDHVLAQRAYLFGWIADVAARAERQGKTLLAFSHYPALAFSPDEAPVVSSSTWAKRMPAPATSVQLAATGLRYHFSGHVHMPGIARLGRLECHSLPSPVAAPGGYVIATCMDGAVSLERIAQPATPAFDLAFAAYRRDDAWPDIAGQGLGDSYDDFLALHAAHLRSALSEPPR